MIAARTEGPLRAEQDRGVLVVTLDRPRRANALTPEMERAYRAVLDEAGRDPDVRVVVVTGAGGAFCSGAEFDDLDALVADPTGSPFAGPDFRDPAHLAKPLVAAIEGACAGMGLVEALLADVRFVAHDARITTSFTRRGIPAEQGIVALLTRSVGETRARDLLLSARVIDGDEAVAMGLASRALPAGAVLDAALAWAHDVAEQCSPTAMTWVKGQFADLVDADLSRTADRASRLLPAGLAGPDFAEGIASFRDRRAPRFDGVSVPLTDPTPGRRA